MKDSMPDCSHTGRAIIADTPAFITGILSHIQETIYTTSKILNEIKDDRSRKLLDIVSTSKKLIIIDPTHKAITKAEEIAAKAGTLTKLSRADLEILALAISLRDRGCTVYIITDDYALQHTANMVGIKIIKIRYRGIRT